MEVPCVYENVFVTRVFVTEPPPRLIETCKKVLERQEKERKNKYCKPC